MQLGRLYNGKNRTFFFAAFEGFQSRLASNALTLSVPTPEMYNGDFSNWVDSQGRRITIYDPATTRPNPNGAGFIRDPFPGNIIPAARFSAVAKQYLALAKSAVVPNRAGLVPGTFGYVSNNFLSPGGTTEETTKKYSVKIDHSLSNTQRLSYLFNRGNNRLQPGDSGAGGPSRCRSTRFSPRASTPTCTAATWDWIGSRIVNHLTFGVNTFNKDAYSPNVGQDWKSKVCIPNAVDCNVNMGALTFTEFSTWGGAADNGTEQPRILDQGRRDLRSGVAHVEDGLHLRPPAGERLRPAGYRRPGRLQLPGNRGSRRDDAGQRRRQLVRVVPARRGGHRQDRNHPLSPAGLSLLWRSISQDDWRINAKLVLNYGAALRVHETAGGRRRSVLGLLADQAESGRQQLSRRPGVCR